MKNSDLMFKWKERLKEQENYNGFFIADGIVNEDEFNKQSKKILFFLLEPYNIDKDRNFKDLNQYLAGGAHSESKTWENGSKIIAKLLNPKLTWGDLYANEIVKNKRACCFKGFKKEQLNKIAMLNIKKEANLASTDADTEQVNKHAILFSDLISEQINLINPDIIYCGGTDYSDVFLTALSTYLPAGTSWEKIDSKKKFYEINYDNVRIINSYHPTKTKEISNIFNLF